MDPAQPARQNSQDNIYLPCDWVGYLFALHRSTLHVAAADNVSLCDRAPEQSHKSNREGEEVRHLDTSVGESFVFQSRPACYSYSNHICSVRAKRDQRSMYPCYAAHAALDIIIRAALLSRAKGIAHCSNRRACHSSFSCLRPTLLPPTVICYEMWHANIQRSRCRSL